MCSSEAERPSCESGIEEGRVDGIGGIVGWGEEVSHCWMGGLSRGAWVHGSF